MDELSFDESIAPPGCFDRKFKIDVGDVFKHHGVGLVCAAVSMDGKRVYWQGWPPGSVPMCECELLTEAAHNQRRLAIIEWGDRLRRFDRDGPDQRSVINRERLGILARERMAAERKSRIDAIILLVQDARARAPGRTAELFRAARLLGRPDEATEALHGMIGEPPA